jgi:hypothetical protein
MVLGLDLTELPPLVQKLIAGEAPAQAVAMAARGVVIGAKPGDALTVIAALSRSADPEVSQGAAQTLHKLPPPLLDGALQTDLQSGVIEVLVEALGTQADIVERVLRLPRISGVALCLLAERADERTGELIATNETLLLKYPQAIEKLYMNKRVRMSTADRVLELAVRNKLALEFPAYDLAAKAIVNELIPEPTLEPTYDDVLFRETQDLAEQTPLEEDADTHEADETGEEVIVNRFLPLHSRIARMTITQKIRTAILGTGAERLLLVRDTNRLVAGAAASSPQFTENDAARVASSRNVHDDVLRIIAKNRTLTRSYQVKLNLVTNPKTPLTFASRLLPHIRDADIRQIAKSKNVPATIQTMARQVLLRKEQKRS